MGNFYYNNRNYIVYSELLKYLFIINNSEFLKRIIIINLKKILPDYLSRSVEP